MMDLPTTGAEARRIGAPKYFTGLPCKFSHIAPRYAHNGQCFECGKAAVQAFRRLPAAKAYQRAYYERRRTESPVHLMWAAAQCRARKRGVLFTITPADIEAVYPKDGKCPVLGIDLTTPSLDKIIPALGYVPGNIAVISMKANMLKGDETDPEVFRKIADWLMCVKGG